MNPPPPPPKPSATAPVPLRLSARAAKVEAAFLSALDLAPEERETFLAGACAEDVELGAEVEAMLALHAKAGGFMDESPMTPEIEAELARLKPEEEGEMIGPFKLREQIGEGGFGTVWVADQEQPVRRRVALKIIKLGMDTKEVIARFEQERQALAMMDHPNIAKVLDAGATEWGRPFFVMELVRGVPITEYCDQNNLSTLERLALFIAVCQAVQHAHQKGIIHRDIKPSNILVTLHDGVPVPKVIDFGIAKATEGRLIDATIYTQMHQFVGTPAYMSPEQAEMSGLDIDTRSDIYSLGVLLYELLTGRTPFDARELMSQGIDAMRRTIREQEPARPSTRLATLHAEELTTTARRRSSESAKLLHQLRGDLDWIVMKCLEKDRTRRYDTANGLAADLRRHLDNEPVLARPASAAYKLRKAFRRNKLAFTAGAAIAVALILGAVGATIGLLRAKQAEALALQSRGDAEKLASFMLDDLYAELEPTGQLDAVAKLAEQAVAYFGSLPPSLRTKETERNEWKARARLALVFTTKGELNKAQALADQLVPELDQVPRAEHTDATLFALGLAVEAQCLSTMMQFSSRFQPATFEKPVATLRSFATAAGGSPRLKLQFANVLNLFGHSQGPTESLATSQEARTILAGIGALDLSNLSAATAWADAADSEARHLLGFSRPREAEELAKQAHALMAEVGARRPTDVRVKRNRAALAHVLTLALAEQFRDDEAMHWATESRQAALEYRRFHPSEMFASDLPVLCEWNIGALQYRAGRITEARDTFREAVNRPAEQPPARYAPRLEYLWLRIARIEAQLENFAAAREAVAQAKRSLHEYAREVQMSDRERDSQMEEDFWVEREVDLAEGKNSLVLAAAEEAVPRLEQLKQSAVVPAVAAAILSLQRETLSQACLAALRLRDPNAADRAARSLLALPLTAQNVPIRQSMDQPEDPVWRLVLQAEAVTLQGRQSEALPPITTAVDAYRDMEKKGATHLSFRQRFARALYVQALAQPTDATGTAQRRTSLAEAAKALGELTEEARQLRDTRALLAWIEAEQTKVGPAPQP